jgi:hypothetical protein
VFFFAIVGGAFSSLIVILASELQKYHLMKNENISLIFHQFATLYMQLTIIHYNVKRQLKYNNHPISEHLIDEIANRGQMCINNINAIDFITFCAYKTIKNLLNQFQQQEGEQIRSFLQDTTFLKIAINEDKLELLQDGIDTPITANSPKTYRALHKILDGSANVLVYLDNLLDTIDKECSTRHKWDTIRQSINLSEEHFVSADLSKFLNQPVIQFKKHKK